MVQLVQLQEHGRGSEIPQMLKCSFSLELKSYDHFDFTTGLIQLTQINRSFGSM